MKLSKNQVLALDVLIKDKTSDDKLYSNSNPYKGQRHLMSELKWNKARSGGVIDHMKRSGLVTVDTTCDFVTPTFLGVAAYLTFIKDKKKMTKNTQVKKNKSKANLSGGLTKMQQQALRVLCKYENFEAQVNHNKTYKGVDDLIEELGWKVDQAHGVVSSLVRTGLATSINRNEFVTPTYQGIVKLSNSTKSNRVDSVEVVKPTVQNAPHINDEDFKTVVEVVENSEYNKVLINKLLQCVTEWQESNIKVMIIQESWSDDIGMYLKGSKEMTLGSCLSTLKNLGEELGQYDPDTNSFYVSDGISVVIPNNINPVLVLSLAIEYGV